jgi:hypothetical protein
MRKIMCRCAQLHDGIVGKGSMAGRLCPHLSKYSALEYSVLPQGDGPEVCHEETAVEPSRKRIQPCMNKAPVVNENGVINP